MSGEWNTKTLGSPYDFEPEFVLISVPCQSDLLRAQYEKTPLHAVEIISILYGDRVKTKKKYRLVKRS